MKIAQIRFGDKDRKDEFCADDRFVLESDIAHVLSTYKIARVFKVIEIDIGKSSAIQDARPWKPMNSFERKAARVAGYPDEPARGYPHTTTTVLLNGEPRSVEWSLFDPRDPYSGPCWALAR